MNVVVLYGNLTRDPETRTSTNGTVIVKFGLAINRRVKEGTAWKDEATFVDVTMFGKRGEAFAKNHKKGRPALIRGELRLDTWDDKNGGGKRSKLYVVAEDWHFAGPKEGLAPKSEESGDGGQWKDGEIAF